jgi:predicted dehydrogenase
MSADLNVCLVGCGSRGALHAERWKAVGGARVVAVCDRDPGCAGKVAEMTGAKVYEDWCEAVMHEGVNVVTQALPSHLHADVTCFAAEHGRHVFGEKPLALTLEQGERMVRAVRDSGIVFMPCFQYRDLFRFRMFRKVFQEGVPGEPVVMRFSDIREVRPKTAMHRRSENGGVVIDMACHIFDLMRHITGGEPEAVFATGRIFGRGKERLREVGDFAVDEASIEALYSGGHTLQMYFNWGMPEKFPTIAEPPSLLGPLAAIRQTATGVEVIHADHREIWDAPTPEPPDERIPRFAAAIRGGEPPDITVEDAMITLRCSHAALESAETGSVVRLA